MTRLSYLRISYLRINNSAKPPAELNACQELAFVYFDDELRAEIGFDLASTAANITTTSAGPVAFFAVTDCDVGDVRFAIATADGAGRRPLASASRT